jgi:pimeloyl-ACP methyl ester carboxylesterase
MVMGLLALLIGLYAVFLLFLRLAEPRLIYVPGPSSHLTPPPPELGLAPVRVEFPSTDGVRLVAWIVRAPTDTAGRWLLICHGNAGNLSEAGRPLHYAGLRALGLNLLAFDYRGYGRAVGPRAKTGCIAMRTPRGAISPTVWPSRLIASSSSAIRSARRWRSSWRPRCRRPG